MGLRDREGLDPEGPEYQQRSLVLVWAMGRTEGLEGEGHASGEPLWRRPGRLRQGLGEQQGRLWGRGREVRGGCGRRRC